MQRDPLPRRMGRVRHPLWLAFRRLPLKRANIASLGSLLVAIHLSRLSLQTGINDMNESKNPELWPDRKLIEQLKDPSRPRPNPQIVAERKFTRALHDVSQLGRGAFEEPGHRRSRLDARMRFPDSVSTHAPESLHALAGDPLHRFKVVGRWHDTPS